MAKKQVAAGPDTPVTNETHEAAPVTKGKSDPPNEGKNPQTNKVTPRGTEQVEGFTPSESARERAPEELKVPDTSKLRDIGEASFGPPPTLAETVHGPDNRVKINTTNIYPWRVHASLLITAADNSQWIGTGWFIGPPPLMTA